MPENTVSGFVKILREERGLTQASFAKLLKTTQSAVARIENGEQNLTTEMYRRIGNILGHDIVRIGNRSLNVEIEGGHRLHGTVTVKTAKNSAVALLSAALLNCGKTTLLGVPRIEEVNRIVDVLRSIGAEVRWRGNCVRIVPPETLSMQNFDIASGTKTRSIIMLAGSLIHRLRRFRLPHPGGCRLGQRTVRPHMFALEKLGVSITARTGYYDIRRKRLAPAEIILYESGDTVTENALLAAALIPGVTIIKYASANYQVQDLCLFLKELGVKIEGIGTTTLKVRGVESVEKPTSYSLSEDPIEAMFFIAAAIVTKSRLRINRCPLDFLELELLKLEKMGFRYRVIKEYRAENGHTRLADIEALPSRLTALQEKIEARPYPGLNIDNLPFFAVIATQAKGQTLIHDWVYEERAIYYKELDKLGAETTLADPHRIFITGPTKLRAAEVICPPALRPAAITLIGMLAAEGRSVLRNIYSINRGYEDIVNRLRGVGARIRILREF